MYESLYRSIRRRHLPDRQLPAPAGGRSRHPDGRHRHRQDGRARYRHSPAPHRLRPLDARGRRHRSTRARRHDTRSVVRHREARLLDHDAARHPARRECARHCSRQRAVRRTARVHSVNVITAVIVLVLGILLGEFVKDLVLASAGTLPGAVNLARAAKARSSCSPSSWRSSSSTSHRTSFWSSSSPWSVPPPWPPARVRPRRPRRRGRDHARLVRPGPRAAARRALRGKRRTSEPPRRGRPGRQPGQRPAATDRRVERSVAPAHAHCDALVQRIDEFGRLAPPASPLADTRAAVWRRPATASNSMACQPLPCLAQFAFIVQAGDPAASIGKLEDSHVHLPCIRSGGKCGSAARRQQGGTSHNPMTLKPLSTNMTSPVTPLARSLHRKSAAFATSACVTLRRSGVRSSTAL
jgi:hypothetical protein